MHSWRRQNAECLFYGCLKVTSMSFIPSNVIFFCTPSHPFTLYVLELNWKKMKHTHVIMCEAFPEPWSCYSLPSQYRFVVFGWFCVVKWLFWYSKYYFCSLIMSVWEAGISFCCCRTHTENQVLSCLTCIHAEALSVYLPHELLIFHPPLSCCWNKWIYRPLIQVQGHWVIHGAAYKYNSAYSWETNTLPASGLHVRGCRHQHEHSGFTK